MRSYSASELDLVTKISSVYPGMVAGVDFGVLDLNDGFGPRVVEWYSEMPVPSNFELESAWAAYRAAQHQTEYRRLRAAEYPPLGDQMDALWKGGTASDEMKATILAVKEKYPKTSPLEVTETPQ